MSEKTNLELAKDEWVKAGLRANPTWSIPDLQSAVFYLIQHLESHPSPVPQTPESVETPSSSPDTAPTVETLTGSRTSSPVFSLVRTDHRGSRALLHTSQEPSSHETLGDVLRSLLLLGSNLPAHTTPGLQWPFGPTPSTTPAADQDGPRAGGNDPSSPSPAIHAQGEEA